MMLEILDLFLVLHQVNFFWNPTDFLLLANAVTEINCPIGLAFYSWILSVLKFFVSQLWLEIINHDQWYLMRSAATPGAASLTNMPLLYPALSPGFIFTRLHICSICHLGRLVQSFFKTSPIHDTEHTFPLMFRKTSFWKLILNYNLNTIKQNEMKMKKYLFLKYHA